jgi:hypothetical protein
MGLPREVVEEKTSDIPETGDKTRPEKEHEQSTPSPSARQFDPTANGAEVAKDLSRLDFNPARGESTLTAGHS